MQRVIQTMAKSMLGDAITFFVGAVQPDSVDPFAGAVVRAAMEGCPVFAATHHQSGHDLGREILHALAGIPSQRTEIAEVELPQFIAAIDTINALDIELIDLAVESVDITRLLRPHNGGGATPVVAVDLRAPQGRSHAPTFVELRRVHQVLGAAKRAGCPVFLALDTTLPGLERVHVP